MTIPNFLSFFRLTGTFLFLFFVIREKYSSAFVVFVLQGLSDLADGLIARIFNTKTELGAFLDPIADKFMLMSSYVVLAYKEIIPQWVMFIVIAKDLFILIGFLILYSFSYRIAPKPRVFGKICTAVEVVTIAYVLWTLDGILRTFLFYLTALFSFLSVFDYLLSGLRILARYRPF